MWIFKILCIFVIVCKTSLAEQSSVCFYTNWAQYRPGVAKFVPEDIDTSLCTHINYAFAKINLETHVLEEYEWNDDEMIGRVNALKQKRPSLQTILSVGGWNHELLPRFSKMVASADTRKVFINSALEFLDKYKFDGLSLDWEYPGNRGSPAGDKQRYTMLVQEVLAAFVKDAISRNTTRYTLTASVAAGGPVIKTAYEIDKIAKYLDWINLMSYDLHGSWENVTGCATATTGDIPTVPNSLSIWLDGGMPANKITLGLASYGRSFLLKSSSDHSLNAPSNGPGQAGQYTRAAGELSFFEVCSTSWSSEQTWVVSGCGTPYASKDRQWIGYDSVASIRHKVLSIVNPHKLRGISYWALDLDDFVGTFCNLGKYPLLKEAVHSMSDFISPNVHFHPNAVNMKCTAASRWQHVKSLVKWCGKHCHHVNKCPKFMCACH